jgi:hypothetical protein
MPDQQPPEPATATEADETPAPESAEPAPGTGSGSPAAAADQPGGTVTAHRGGGLRVSHQERDRVVEELRVAAGDGRLTADELDDRLERALGARTYADLAMLTTDLPAEGADGALAAPAKDLITIDVGSGHAAREGRWTLPQRMDIKVTSGAVKLDLTEAVATRPALQLDVRVRSGQLLLVTKPGIVVDMDDVAVRSGQVKVRAPWGASVPVTLRVTVAGSCGSGSILARPPRRSLWQWLRRAPRPYQIAA